MFCPNVNPGTNAVFAKLLAWSFVGRAFRGNLYRNLMQAGRFRAEAYAKDNPSRLKNRPLIASISHQKG